METTDASGPDSLPLLLRPWSVSDAGGLREAIDEDVHHLRPWLSWTLEEPSTVEQTRVRLLDWIGQFRSGEAYRFAITPPDRPGTILGGAHLSCRVGPAAHDIGYWVRKSAARRGIASAAVAKLLQHAFEQRTVDRVIIQCDVANAASAALARRLDFELVGPALKAYPNGVPRPVLQFEMAREDYLRHHAQATRLRAARVRLTTQLDNSGAL